MVSTNRPGARRLGTVGQPIPGVTLRIDDAVSPEPGEGEIIVYGPNVMAGYHNRPDETARAFTEDGGLRTGDLGHLDDDGYLHVTGRIKEQYKLENGKYVMPTPLEEELALSPYIANVMLYGSGHAYNVALIVLDLERVEAWAAEHRIELGDDPTQNPWVRDLIAGELEHAAEGFRGYERPRAFALVDRGLHRRRRHADPDAQAQAPQRGRPLRRPARGPVRRARARSAPGLAGAGPGGPVTGPEG